MQKKSIPFKLDLKRLGSILDAVLEGASTYGNVARPLGIGKPKVRFFCYWGMVLKLVESRSSTRFPYQVTDLYPRLREHLLDFAILQVLYSLACSNHVILSFIVNDFVWERFVEAIPSFSSPEVRREAATALGLSEESLKRQIPIHLGTLTDRNGFGNLGLIEKQGPEYVLCPLQPAPLVAAYNIYSNWPSNTAKVAISQIVSGRNSVGRIFFLTKFQVMSILRELEDQGLVKIETAAGLDQIGRDPNITPDDILEMILTEV
jgi:hypothetical protein